MRIIPLIFVLACLTPAACSEVPREEAAGAGEATAELSQDPQGTFWASLQELCGQAFEGTITESQPPDNSFAGQRLLMHVRECEESTVRIPFHVGDDRSRTWVITDTEGGLRLKHDHRHEDGTEDALTQYGGDTSAEGSATVQEFPADAQTAEVAPAAVTNIWTVEIHPGQTFAYALRRVGSDRRFRVEFDLTSPVEEPPPPWGA